MEGDTPLHCAARLSVQPGFEDDAKEVVEMLLEAGADPRYVAMPRAQTNCAYRVRNKGKLKAIDILPPQHTELRTILKRAELKYVLSYDVVEGSIPLGEVLINR
jgi:DNA-directed RNA polymerase subunit F